MKLACIHCGKSFVILAQQLGTTGRCPHCRGEIALPKASDQLPHERQRIDPRAWLDYSISGLSSMIFHMLLVLIFALFQGEGSNTAGPGEEVSIGTLPIEELGETPGGELEAESIS